jgi:coatomer subunit beta'
LQALRNKSFGQALDFVWSAYGTGDYAARESTSRVKVFKNFKETHAFKPGVPAEGIYGGALLGVRSVDTIVFYDWDSDKVVRRIEVGGIKGVYWNETGTLVAIATDESYFVLRFSREAYVAGMAAATSPLDAAAAAEEGIEAAFELQVSLALTSANGAQIDCVFTFSPLRSTKPPRKCATPCGLGMFSSTRTVQTA